MKRIFLLLLSLVTFSSLAASPDEMMKRLVPLTGVWELTVEYTQDKGKTWQASVPTQINVELAHKNKLLREIPITPIDKGFNMETYLSFDQYRNVFRKAAIDDVWGIMDVYEGHFENEKLVMTNLKSGTTFPMKDGKSRAFRLSIEIASPNRVMTIEASDDNGASWQPSFVAKYKLIKP